MVILLTLAGLNFNYAQIIHSTNFNVNQGLSQSSVTCFMKDKRGFLWIGTQDGLNRFDGYKFKTFKNKPTDTNSLSHNYINDIIESEKGLLWIATNYGLNRYDPVNGEFEVFLADSMRNSIPENPVFNLYQDDEGSIWIQTSRYLTCYAPETNNFTSYKYPGDYFNYYEADNNFAILRDHQDRLWVGTNNGLNYFNEALGEFNRYKYDSSDKQSLTNSKIQVIYEDNSGNLWIGTDAGLNKFNRNTGDFKRYYVDTMNIYHDVNNINDICIDKEGLFWVGTEAGLYLFKPGEGKFEDPDNLLHNSSRLTDIQINKISCFTSNIIWVGTLQGLVKLQKNLKDFRLYKKDDDNQPLFADNLIASVYKDKYNRIWVGTWNKGLYRLDRETFRMERFIRQSPYIPGNDVHTLFPDSRNRLWIGTDQGVSYYDLKTRSFHFIEPSHLQKIFTDNRIYSIDEDQSGRLWFGTRKGLHVYAEGDMRSFYGNSNDTNSLTSSLVYDVMIDSNDTLWVATNKGFNKYLGSGKGFKQFRKKSLACHNCLASNEVLCLHEDSAGYIWIGTVGGLNRFNPRNEEFKTYTEQDGLPNNLIYAILEDDNGNLWLSSNMGITKFDPVSEIFLNFDIYDGLQAYEFNHLAAYKASDGEMFFGGISGLNSFYPDSIRRDTTIPNIEITSVEMVTNQEKRTHDLLATDSLTISYKNNLITIEFVSLDLMQPSQNKYAYRLEGVENEWVNIGNRRYATFSNLAPGEYTFRVKGSNNDNIWNDKGTSLHIIVETPYWQSDLALLIYGGLSISLLVLIFHWRNKRLKKKKQQRKERERFAQQIAKQKEELTNKNKSITDSLLYAKRIQEALLASNTDLNNLLKNSFILFKPKDIVSGDFYWIHEKDDKLFLAVVDCTGHGVPGAFMSIIGVELFDHIVNDQGITEVGNILYEMNKAIFTALSQEEDKTRSIRDGMDIALCVVDKKKRELEFAGAFRPMYLLRDNKIEEVKGDRFSVGLHEELMDATEITKSKFSLTDHDMIYLFTDGYADQFGGPEGKKYKYRRFRHLLLNIHKLPVVQQKYYLEKSIEDWMKDQEQVDDILIVGFNPQTLAE
ncbi:MAG: SpoIIE family protein phosphatase [Bacteroidales bacterium]|nr:SpoIIE family protein phosphatase [Bacteroidales bacterium]